MRVANKFTVKKFSVLICIFFVATATLQDQISHAQEKEGVAVGQERLSQLVLQCDELDQKYEVAFFVQTLIKMSERDGAGVVLQEYLVRQVRDDNDAKYRADVKGLQEGSSRMTFRKHFLDLREVTLTANGYLERNSLKVNEYPQDVKAPPMVWGYSNMFAAPLSSYPLLQHPELVDVLSLNMNMRVVEAKKIEGVFTLTLVPYEGRGGIVIEFKDEPSWIPVKVETYSSDGELIALDSVDIAKDLRSTGIPLARIVSRWKEQSDGLWVPTYVRSANFSHTKMETDVEIWFSDWRFGDNIDSKSLTKESFTKEALLGIDFDQLRESVKKNIEQEK